MGKNLIFAEGEEAWRMEATSRRLAYSYHQEHMQAFPLVRYPECLESAARHRNASIEKVNRPDKAAELAHDMARWIRYAAPASWGMLEERGKTQFPFERPSEVGPYTWAHGIAGMQAEWLEQARPWWISKRTMSLAEKSAKKLPRYRLAEADLPNRQGLMVLTEPIPLPLDTRTSVYGTAELEIVAISWGKTMSPITSERWNVEDADGIWLSVWALPQDLRDLVEEKVPPEHIESFALNASCSPLVYDREAVIPFINEWREWPDSIGSHMLWIVRMFATLCNIIKAEKLTETTTQRPDPKSRLTKSRRRKGKPLPDTRVVNVRGMALRATEPTTAGGGKTGRSYSVWRPVVPYPKWVYYPSEDRYELKIIEGHQRRATNRPNIDTVYKVDRGE